MVGNKRSIDPRTAEIIRHFVSIALLLSMVAVSEFSGEREILFPEMAALTIGMWIVDKSVWRVSGTLLVILMTAGAAAGVCIVRYSVFSTIPNIALAFIFPAICLMVSGATLIPQVSACMLPVLLGTDSWIYPVAVFVMSLTVVLGQRVMIRYGLRSETACITISRSVKAEALRWLVLLCTVIAVAVVPIYTGNIYCILPPLIVTYIEFSSSKSGFRSRPLQVFFFLVSAAVMGAVGAYCGHILLGLPKTIAALPVLAGLLSIFKKQGKYFAPAGAVALVPMIIPSADLFWFPMQVAVGTAIFLILSMVLFHKCYRWSRAQLIAAFVPSRLLHLRKRQRV